MFKYLCTAVSSEAWAKLRDWASVAGRGWLLLSGSVAQASLKTAVNEPIPNLRPMGSDNSPCATVVKCLLLATLEGR